MSTNENETLCSVEEKKNLSLKILQWSFRESKRTLTSQGETSSLERIEIKLSLNTKTLPEYCKE